MNNLNPIKEILEYCSISVFQSEEGYDLFISCQDDIWVLITEHYPRFIAFLRSNDMQTNKFEPSKIKSIVLVSVDDASHAVTFEIRNIKINIFKSVVKVKSLFIIFFQKMLLSILEWSSNFLVYDVK